MTPRRRSLVNCLVLVIAAVPVGCRVGPSVSGSFDRSFDVTGHTRLEVSEASGEVEVIGGSSDGKVHVHGLVRASGMGFNDPKNRLAEALANPGVEQRGDTIRIGKHFSIVRNVSITYHIEVPKDTEANLTTASASMTVRDIRGPVTATSASGAIQLDHVERDVRMTSMSGDVHASDIGDDVRASSASGEITIRNAKGDVRANSLSGRVQVLGLGGRVEANSASGSIEVQGATADAKAHSASGEVNIAGDPGANGYWDLKTASGKVQLNVPLAANFHLSAESASGEIRADIPIVIEEQNKHSLRAHVGDGGGRVEVRTVSGEIHVSKPA
ncbi:MAG: DUF4097 domain-containing protein [Acidobacteriota bacterium]|nr:DUF4097 domain-containing protein [Acidobacteriota bacterium]